MSKVLSISFSNYVYETYLKNAKCINKSKFIEEMFIKGINSELGELEGVQLKAIEGIKKIREQDELILNLQRDLQITKSKLMNQEKRQQEKERKKLIDLRTQFIEDKPNEVF